MEEKIQHLRYLMSEVAEVLLKENQPHIILPGYDYYREVLSLYSKQHNLLESTLVLLDNNMAEEAYILLRSMLSNEIWIVSLCDDNVSRSRLNDYLNQPIINRLNLLENTIRVKNKDWFKDAQSRGDNKFDFDNIDIEIKELKKLIVEKGIVGSRLVSVASLAKKNELLFGLYISIYSEASQHEHSDPSVLGLYRKKILDEYDNNSVFTVDLSSTSEELKQKVLNFAADIYGYSFIHIVKHITNNEDHLLVNYDKQRLVKLMLLLGSL